MATGKCQKCEFIHDVIKGRLVPHEIPLSTSAPTSNWSTLTPGISGPILLIPDGQYALIASPRCSGSGKPSVEQAAVNRERRVAHKRRAVEAAREDAQVVHDMVASGVRVDKAWLDGLLELARVAYRLQYPARGYFQPWSVVARSMYLRDGSDVYCTFCRELLIGGYRPLVGHWADQPMEADIGKRTSAHTTICALRVLAGIAEPVAPYERRIPSEHRADDQDVPSPTLPIETAG